MGYDMRKNEWIIIDDVGMRLDKFLVKNDSGISRNQLQVLIESEQVLVNEKKSKANYRLQLEDHVSIIYPDDKEKEIIPVAMSLDICYEDDDVVVINKPKNLVVHPAVGNEQNTLVSGLLAKYGDHLSDVNGVYRPGIVHRLDKDTTGLILIAKNNRAHEIIAKELKDKTMTRKYYALVHGEVLHDYGTIDAPIGRDTKERQKMNVTAKNSKEAKTHFKVLEYFNGYTLLRCELETGRTHQIRVHMKYIGHPIVGDQVYGRKKDKLSHTQLLHAYELGFIQPTTKEKVIVQAPLTKEFEDILSNLRK